MECAKAQAATKLVSQADRNVSRKARKPPQLKAFCFQNYQYNRQYCITTWRQFYLQSCTNTQVDARTCLVQFWFPHYLEYVLLLTNNFLTYCLIFSNANSRTVSLLFSMLDLTYDINWCDCANLLWLIFLFSTRKPWLAAISHYKPSIVTSHGLSRLASHKDCKPAVWD